MKIKYAVNLKRMNAHYAPAGFVTSFDICYDAISYFETRKQAEVYVSENASKLSGNNFFVIEEIYCKG